jgi:hypothetical protein
MGKAGTLTCGQFKYTTDYCDTYNHQHFAACSNRIICGNLGYKGGFLSHLFPRSQSLKAKILRSLAEDNHLRHSKRAEVFFSSLIRNSSRVIRPSTPVAVSRSKVRTTRWSYDGRIVGKGRRTHQIALVRAYTVVLIRSYHARRHA